MTQYGQILFKQTGNESTIAEWYGPPVAQLSQRQLARMSHKYPVTVGDVAQIGPYRLRVVGMERDFCTVVQANKKWLWLYMAWHRIVQSARWVNERIILTLIVWGLAQENPAEYPHWGWVARKWKRNK